MAQSGFGLLAFVFLAWLISENRRRIPLGTVAAGLALQIGVALLMLHVPGVEDFFGLLNRGVQAISHATDAGTAFVFGYLGGGKLPFAETSPGASFVLAFKALPLILVISALSSLLFYWRVIPVVVGVFSLFLQKTMRIGGALGLGVAANVFVGMVEAPLTIKPYLSRMTRSELFALMTSGMATIAGTVLVLYAMFIEKVVPGAVGHILTASIISAPAAIVVAKVMVPESADVTRGAAKPPQTASSSMDAVTRGTMDGLSVFLNVMAMLIVLVALVALANEILSLLPDVGGKPLTLQGILGWVMAPVVWLTGIPWNECMTAGTLMGTKTVLNEFIAYLNMANLPEGALSQRSMLIMTYAMCGFANLGSLGIMIGGLNVMIPERRREIVGMGMKSLVSGTLATLMTGAVVGLLT
ncbi:NupC/NupG family nucleoside CNT transporter [Pseudodesulfovibrio senegalensis]|jgi:CNT family concentrative nucleoside transporter|uniref:Nucleoside:proton symporter n=1 Tax=Pseudodesulfovibrio senegalensis TaxID=1721087 RepID=A0A6N6N044_9BACT|nr:nucleoside transporter C-terminal domain-containing protein [Pseudodesulfovibrio senegalensis]KAB1437215.1 nucleoside:proton symporter [Pseudodesulfovibrio senegalensis]